LSILCWTLVITAVVKGTLLLFGYLNNQVFPQPLEAEEERLYLDQLQQGNAEARNKLIEHNLRLVAHVVKKYDGSGEDMEDLISIGTIGLIKAIKTFNHDRGVRLATYAARCIENEVLMHFRNIKKLRQEVSIHDPIGHDKEGNEISLMDILTTDSEILEIIDNRMQGEKIKDKMDLLSGREREVIEMRYGIFNGLKETQRDIAAKLGISRSYVSRIEKRAVNKLIRELSLEANNG
jgi:RNA polymerase sporulation-specific sigma factor